MRTSETAITYKKMDLYMQQLQQTPVAAGHLLRPLLLAPMPI